MIDTARTLPGKDFSMFNNNASSARPESDARSAAMSRGGALMRAGDLDPPEQLVSRRSALARFAAVGAAACFGASAFGKGPFPFLETCYAYALTPEFYNCKTGKWLLYIAHRPGKISFGPLASPEPNVKTRVRLVHTVTRRPIPGVRCDLDKRSYSNDKFPWHHYDSKLSDKDGYATFDPIYLSPGITWQFRYSAPCAETVYRLVRV